MAIQKHSLLSIIALGAQVIAKPHKLEARGSNPISHAGQNQILTPTTDPQVAVGTGGGLGGGIGGSGAAAGNLVGSVGGAGQGVSLNGGSIPGGLPQGGLPISSLTRSISAALTQATGLKLPGAPAAPGLPPLAVPSPLAVPPVNAPGLPPLAVPSPSVGAPGLPPLSVPSAAIPPVNAPGLPPLAVPSPPVGAPALPPLFVPSLPTIPPANAPGLPPLIPPGLPPANTPGLPPASVPSPLAVPPVNAPGLPPLSPPAFPPVNAPGLPPLSPPSVPSSAPTLPGAPSLLHRPFQAFQSLPCRTSLLCPLLDCQTRILFLQSLYQALHRFPTSRSRKHQVCRLLLCPLRHHCPMISMLRRQFQTLRSLRRLAYPQYPFRALLRFQRCPVCPSYLPLLFLARPLYPLCQMGYLSLRQMSDCPLVCPTCRHLLRLLCQRRLHCLP